MKIEFLDSDGVTTIDELPKRVRAILGVPEELLVDDVILSIDFLMQADSYVNNKIKEYEGLNESLIKIAYIYYICYLLCLGMYSRLPKQMENLSTKTVLQTIDWDSKALECLEKSNELILDTINEVEEETMYNTAATLSDETTYPNTVNI